MCCTHGCLLLYRHNWRMACGPVSLLRLVWGDGRVVEGGSGIGEGEGESVFSKLYVWLHML